MNENIDCISIFIKKVFNFVFNLTCIMTYYETGSIELIWSLECFVTGQYIVILLQEFKVSAFHHAFFIQKFEKAWNVRLDAFYQVNAHLVINKLDLTPRYVF